MKSYFPKKKTSNAVPSDVFKECPMCDGRSLLRFDGEAFCNECDWNSIAATVDAIGMRAFRLGGGIAAVDEELLLTRVERAHEALIA